MATFTITTLTLPIIALTEAKKIFVTYVCMVTGVAVDQILKCGWTALMYACSSGRPIVVQTLLDHEADPNMHKGMPMTGRQRARAVEMRKE